MNRCQFYQTNKDFEFAALLNDFMRKTNSLIALSPAYIRWYSSETTKHPYLKIRPPRSLSTNELPLPTLVLVHTLLNVCSELFYPCE